jgi:hypothetical protein
LRPDALYLPSAADFQLSDGRRKSGPFSDVQPSAFSAKPRFRRLEPVSKSFLPMGAQRQERLSAKPLQEAQLRQAHGSRSNRMDGMDFTSGIGSVQK